MNYGQESITTIDIGSLIAPHAPHRCKMLIMGTRVQGTWELSVRSSQPVYKPKTILKINSTEERQKQKERTVNKMAEQSPIMSTSTEM